MAQIVYWLGLLLVVGTLCHLAVSLFRAVQRAYWERAIYRAKWAACAEQIEQLANWARQKSTNATQQDELGWKGTRKFRIRRRYRESSDVVSFELVPHDGKSIASYYPGQYVTVAVTPPGQNKPLVRCYSLSDAARDDHYRISIKRATAPEDQPGAPDGAMSTYAHESLKEGDLVDVQAPQGDFFVDPDAPRNLVLVAGGIGITPMISVINTLASRVATRPVYLFYVVRDGSCHPFRDHLREVMRDWPQLHIYVFYTRPRPEDTQGVDYSLGGRLSVDHLRQVLPSNNFEFYVCGPGGMMADITNSLAAWGVPPERIHTEAFGPSSRRTTQPKKMGVGGTVEFARSGKKVPWDTTCDSLLALAEAYGVVVDAGCRSGNCGTCMTAVQRGNVAHEESIGFQAEEGSCLPCVAVPEGDVVLDA